MSLFRRSSAPAPQLVTDLAMDDPELASARDAAVRTGAWQPAADLLASTASDPDRRGAVANALAAAAVQPAGWLDSWLTERPDDPGAHLVGAWAMVQRAWEARGHAYARQTGEDAFAAFFRILGDALPLAHHAVRTGGDDPTPWVVETWLSIGRGDGRDVLDDRWGELVARDPANRLGHVVRLQCLAEKWYGSHEEMYAYARDVHRPAWAPVVPLQAHVEYEMRERTEGRGDAIAGFWSRPDVEADLDAGHRWAVGGGHGHAFALHDLSVVAYALSMAERWAEAAEVFALTGHRSFEYPWYYRADPAAALEAAHARAVKAAR